MSVKVMTQVFAASKSALGSRCVMMALADAAHDDGVCWLDETTIATKANVSESTVRRAIRDLENLGEVQVAQAQRGQRRINVYRVVLPGVQEIDYSRLPFEVDFGTTGQSDRWSTTGQSDTDDRSISAVATGQSDERVYRGTVSGPVKGTVSAPGTVDRKRVTPEERSNAQAVLALFNQVFATRFASNDYLSKIIMRIREYPELTIDQHGDVIRAAHADPWWRGNPSPSVVYGNPGVFENAMQKVGRNGHGGPVTLQEAAKHGTVWGPGTQYETIAEARRAGVV